MIIPSVLLTLGLAAAEDVIVSTTKVRLAEDPSHTSLMIFF